MDGICVLSLYIYIYCGLVCFVFPSSFRSFAVSCAFFFFHVAHLLHCCETSILHTARILCFCMLSMSRPCVTCSLLVKCGASHFFLAFFLLCSPASAGWERCACSSSGRSVGQLHLPGMTPRRYGCCRMLVLVDVAVVVVLVVLLVLLMIDVALMSISSPVVFVATG